MTEIESKHISVIKTINKNNYLTQNNPFTSSRKQKLCRPRWLTCLHERSLSLHQGPIPSPFFFQGIRHFLFPDLRFEEKMHRPPFITLWSHFTSWKAFQDVPDSSRSVWSRSGSILGKFLRLYNFSECTFSNWNMWLF